MKANSSMFHSQPGDPAFVLLTCEHGGHDVPPDYKILFRGASKVLASHRGYDIGALGVSLQLASRLSLPIVFSTVTRLLVDLNRSADHPDAFSEFTRNLPEQQRNQILAAFHAPHRESVERTVALAIAAGRRVMHLGVHSCTDVLHGSTRDFDVSLLFDENRSHEEELCDRFRSSLRMHADDLRYAFNEPYNGADDGLTTTLRSRFAPELYLGIEIEVRQGMIHRPSEQAAVGDLLANAMQSCMSERCSFKHRK